MLILCINTPKPLLLKNFSFRGGYGTTKEEFETIPDAEFDEYVRSTTDFESWLDMQEAAGAAYISKRLGF